MGQLTENGSLRCFVAFQSQPLRAQVPLWTPCTSCSDSGRKKKRNFYWTFSSAVPMFFAKFLVDASWVREILCLQVPKESRYEAKHFGLWVNSRDLGHCLPKLSWSQVRVGSGADLIWLITWPRDVLKFSPPQLESSILKESHWNVFGEVSPSLRKPAVIFYFWHRGCGNNAWETLRSEIPDENAVNLDI